jgi:hypothetical protein
MIFVPSWVKQTAWTAPVCSSTLLTGSTSVIAALWLRGVRGCENQRFNRIQARGMCSLADKINDNFHKSNSSRLNHTSAATMAAAPPLQPLFEYLFVIGPPVQCYLCLCVSVCLSVWCSACLCASLPPPPLSFLVRPSLPIDRPADLSRGLTGQQGAAG